MEHPSRLATDHFYTWLFPKPTNSIQTKKLLRPIVCFHDELRFHLLGVGNARVLVRSTDPACVCRIYVCAVSKLRTRHPSERSCQGDAPEQFVCWLRADKLSATDVNRLGCNLQCKCFCFLQESSLSNSKSKSCRHVATPLTTHQHQFLQGSLLFFFRMRCKDRPLQSSSEGL